MIEFKVIVDTTAMIKVITIVIAITQAEMTDQTISTNITIMKKLRNKFLKKQQNQMKSIINCTKMKIIGEKLLKLLLKTYINKKPFNIFYINFFIIKNPELE